MNSRFNRRYSTWLPLGVLTLGILLRFLYLDSDPHYYEWVGYITDEGRWVQHARSLVLFGKLFALGEGFHLFLAPLFQLTNYIVFELSEVSILTSRIFTALCGSATLVLFWGFLRRTVTPEALLLGISLIAFQTDLVVLSRMAVPEMAIMFFQLLIYFMLVSKGDSSHRMLLAGFLLWVAVGMKATMAPFLAIFSIIILFIPLRNSEMKSAMQRWRNLALFWIGFAIPLLLVALVWFFLCLPEISSFVSSATFIKNFTSGLTKHWIGMSSAYDVISFFFENLIARTFNIWALGLWISVLGWMAVNWDDIDFQLRRYLQTSGIWFTLYLILMLVLDYFPSRYKVHILIPMAVMITVGISLIQWVTFRKVVESFTNGEGLSQILRLTILSLPIAVFASPLLASAVGLAGVDPVRLRFKLLCLVISLIAATFVAHRLKENKLAVGFYLICPLVAGTLWFSIQTLSQSGYAFWPSSDTQFHAAAWSMFLLVASGFTMPLVKATLQRGQTACRKCVTAFAMFYLTISLAGIVPSYINPSYSIKQTSRDLGRLLSASKKIVCWKAEGLFNGNSLSYTDPAMVDWRSEMPEIIVAAFPEYSLKHNILTEYELVKTYDLYVSPEYYRLHPETVEAFPRGKIVKVYKRHSNPARN